MFTLSSRLFAASAVAAFATLAAPIGISTAAGGGGGGGGGGVKPVVTATAQVIAFPSRDFVSVSEPGGTSPTTTWTHLGSPVQTSTSIAPGLPTAMGTVDINHVGIPCWSSLLTAPTSNMSPGDAIKVTTPAGPLNQQLTMKVADVRTVQAALVPLSNTKVTVTGSAKDPVSGLQIAPGLLQVRLIAKQLTFSFNGRRDLVAVLGGGKDGALTYTTPGSTTDFSFRATFDLLGGKNFTAGAATLDAQQAVTAQTRGIVQNDAVNPTTMTIYETHIFGDGLVHGNAPGCPAV